MNSIFKKISIVVTVLLVISGMTACDSKPKQTPSEVVSLYMDALITQDFAALNEYTGLEENSNKLRDELELGMESAGIRELNAGNAEELADAFLRGLHKVTYTVSDVSEEKNTGIVDLTITGIDFGVFMARIQEDVFAKATAGELTTEEQVTEYVFAKTVEYLDDPIMAKQPTFEGQLMLKKEHGKWVLADENSVYDSLGEGLLTLQTE